MVRSFGYDQTGDPSGRARIKKLARDWIEHVKPYAFGICGLTPDQFRHLNPRQFNEIYDAAVKKQQEEWRFRDMLNARQCEIIALCAGNKDAKLADFLILRREIENDKEDWQTPEQMTAQLSNLVGG